MGAINILETEGNRKQQSQSVPKSSQSPCGPGSISLDQHDSIISRRCERGTRRKCGEKDRKRERLGNGGGVTRYEWCEFILHLSFRPSVRLSSHRAYSRPVVIIPVWVDRRRCDWPHNAAVYIYKPIPYCKHTSSILISLSASAHTVDRCGLRADCLMTRKLRFGCT